MRRSSSGRPGSNRGKTEGKERPMSGTPRRSSGGRRKAMESNDKKRMPRKAGQTKTPRSNQRVNKAQPRGINNTVAEQAMNFGAGPQAPTGPQGQVIPGMMGRPGMPLAGLRTLQARMQGNRFGMY